MSTEGQARKGESLILQHEAIERNAQVLGHKTTVWYEGQEHATPQQERATFERMLREAPSDMWDAVMVTDASRWSRDNEISKRAVRVLKENGKRLFVGTYEVPLWSANARTMLGLQVEMHEGTAGHLVERSIATKIKRMVEGRPSIGSKPYGRKWDGTKWVIDKEEAALFKRAVALVHKKRSLQFIADTLGGTSATWHYRLKRGGGSRIVKAKDERGKSHEFKQTFPALLSQGEQRELTERLRANQAIGRYIKRDGTPVRRYVLAGKVRCAACGQILCGMPDSRNPRVWRYAHKKIPRRDSLPQCVRTVRGESIEWLVFERLTSMIATEKTLEHAVAAHLDNSGQRRGELEAELLTLKREHAKATKWLDEQIDTLAATVQGGKLDKVVKKRAEALSDQIDANKERTAEVERELAVLTVSAEQIAEVKRVVDILVSKHAKKTQVGSSGDVNGWDTRSKRELLDAFFGPESLRRRKEDMGIYVNREGGIDHITGRFMPTPGLIDAVREGWRRPRIKPGALHVLRSHTAT